MEVKVIAIEHMMPERQHSDDAGADLKADRPCRIAPGTTRMVFTGTRWDIPCDYESRFCPECGERMVIE